MNQEEFDNKAKQADSGYDDDDNKTLSPEEKERLKAITSKEELFEYLDSQLSDKEKEDVINSEEFELHFGVALLIRNLFIYPGLVDVGTIFELDLPFGIVYDPDGVSNIIAKEYQQYLKDRIVATSIKTTDES